MKPDLHRDDSLTSQLSTEKLVFKLQLTSLYMVSTPYKSQFIPKDIQDLYVSYASKHLAPNKYWTANNQKIFTLQLKFL